MAIPYDNETITESLDWLMQECILRFLYFESQHRRNCIALYERARENNEQPKKRTKNYNNHKRQLFVLDLDETLVYQRIRLSFNSSASVRSLHLQMWKHNVDSLKFSLQKSGIEYILGVYRPKLMEFISKYTNDDYDFVVYTTATVNIAVYHLVMIEMYFKATI